MHFPPLQIYGRLKEQSKYIHPTRGKLSFVRAKSAQKINPRTLEQAQITLRIQLV